MDEFPFESLDLISLSDRSLRDSFLQEKIEIMASRPMSDILNEFLSELSRSIDLSQKRVCSFFEAFYEICFAKFKTLENELMTAEKLCRSKEEIVIQLKEKLREKEQQISLLFSSLERAEEKVKALEDEVANDQFNHRKELQSFKLERKRLEDEKTEVTSKLQDFIRLGNSNSVFDFSKAKKDSCSQMGFKSTLSFNETLFEDLIHQRDITEEYRSEMTELKSRLESLQNLFKASLFILQGPSHKNLSSLISICLRVLKGEEYSLSSLRFEAREAKRRPEFDILTSESLTSKKLDDLEQEIKNLINISDKLADECDSLETKCHPAIDQPIKVEVSSESPPQLDDIESKKAKYIKQVFELRKKKSN